jgi:hypothetical protein
MLLQSPTSGARHPFLETYTVVWGNCGRSYHSRERLLAQTGCWTARKYTFE